MCLVTGIEKSSSAELAEAINSMYSWYARAHVCFAYLSDVQTFMDPIRWSRWFTRGWTLQELIAPKHLIFFSRDWMPLGTRQNLCATITSITGVPHSVFGRAEALPKIKFKDRIKWVETRQTTRPEDLAYCLMGICDVHLPIIYGEGQKKAFRRLRREIEDCERSVSRVKLAHSPKIGFEKIITQEHDPTVDEWQQLAQHYPGSQGYHGQSYFPSAKPYLRQSAFAQYGQHGQLDGGYGRQQGERYSQVGERYYTPPSPPV
jgi:hypothetical protein